MSEIMKTRIGCSGWQYSEWKDKFYGPGLAKSGWFDFYAKHYNTVEINYSYYQFPSEKTILAWREQAPHNFTYSLKVNKSIIYKRFINTKSMLNDFYGLAKLLGSTLDCLLIQWPASVKYDLGLLHRMLEQLD
ncbi:MAG TPA: DUF72 domain-containing protein, partial [Coxiellaceae bacterium]|nr:DUF72 domain-containing protein [Coxiellaceae bacterium]